MKHTNAERGNDGRFGATDAPKAKRIEVWLQPQTVELLDVLCKQWGVGRGKVIDQLITRGPVAPAAWSEAETKPTPSAPQPEPPPAPTPAPQAEPEPTARPEPRFKVGDPVDLITHAGKKPDPLGVITESFWFDEPFTNSDGDLTYQPQWVYTLDTDNILPEQILELHQPPAPPEPTPSGPFRSQEVRAANAPGAQKRKVWLGVRIDYDSDFSKIQSVQTNEGKGFTSPGALQLETAQSFNSPLFFAGPVRTNDGHPFAFRFQFAINANTGEPWLNGLEVPPGAISTAWQLLQEAQSSTPSGPLNWEAFADPNWDQLVADAKALGIKGVNGNHIRSFKSRHKIPQGSPLSPEAQQLFRDERETADRVEAGEARDIAQRTTRLAERATPDRLAAIAQTVAAIPPAAFNLATAKAFLLDGLETVGIKRRSKLVLTLWLDLQKLVGAAAPAEQFLLDDCTFILPEDQTAARCLFWGTVIRLATSEGEPPTAPSDFLEWSSYAIHQSHAERGRNRTWDDFAQATRGKPTSSEDRRALQLPPEAVLTSKGINDAYKALAKQHHPDAGGAAAQFQRITEARDRLLLTVAE